MRAARRKEKLTENIEAVRRVIVARRCEQGSMCLEDARQRGEASVRVEAMDAATVRLKAAAIAPVPATVAPADSAPTPGVAVAKEDEAVRVAAAELRVLLHDLLPKRTEGPVGGPTDGAPPPVDDLTPALTPASVDNLVNVFAKEHPTVLVNHAAQEDLPVLAEMLRANGAGAFRTPPLPLSPAMVDAFLYGIVKARERNSAPVVMLDDRGLRYAVFRGDKSWKNPSGYSLVKVAVKEASASG